MNSIKFHSQRFISGPEKGSTRVIYPPHFGQIPHQFKILAVQNS